jgi:hypothetical protein
MSKNGRGGIGFIFAERDRLHSPAPRHQLRHRLRGLLQRPEKLLHHLLRGMPLRIAASSETIRATCEHAERGADALAEAA